MMVNAQLSLLYAVLLLGSAGTHKASNSLHCLSGAKRKTSYSEMTRGDSFEVILAAEFKKAMRKALTVAKRNAALPMN